MTAVLEYLDFAAQLCSGLSWGHGCFQIVEGHGLSKRCCGNHLRGMAHCNHFVLAATQYYQDTTVRLASQMVLLHLNMLLQGKSLYGKLLLSYGFLA